MIWQMKEKKEENDEFSSKGNVRLKDTIRGGAETKESSAV